MFVWFLEQLLSKFRYKTATFDLSEQLFEKLWGTFSDNLEQLVESPEIISL